MQVQTRNISHTEKHLTHEVPIPNLVQIQLDSYNWFLQVGMRELFADFSPIEDFTGKWKLEIKDYTLGSPKYDVVECRERDMTYEAPIKAVVTLTSTVTKETIESQDVYLGDLPLMTERGTFVINGAERVVVSQLSRSAGVYFNETMDDSARVLYSCSLIPTEGSWITIECEPTDVVMVRIGPSMPKFPITILLRALHNYHKVGLPPRYEVIPLSEAVGRELAENIVDRDSGEIVLEAGARLKKQDLARLEPLCIPPERPGKRLRGKAAQESRQPIVKVVDREFRCHTDEDFLRVFGNPITLKKPSAEELAGLWAIEDIAGPDGKLLVARWNRLDKEAARVLAEMEPREIALIRLDPYIDATLQEDTTHNKEEALKEVYRRIRPKDPVTDDGAESLLRSMLFDPRRYDLGRVGRYKVNKKLGIDVPLSVRTVTVQDIVGILKYFIKLRSRKGSVDDIDHLENKRVRSVGELLQSQLRMGFLRMEKVAKERMTSLDPENMIPQVVLSVKPISASIKSFFGSSQLSQFMDQTNPLSELAHKRRLSVLGTGGLSRQKAKLEVRDVHHSHYGRICPIETPEGPNIGLIGSMAMYARVNEFGFLETPFFVVRDGKVTDEVIFLTADDDDKYKIVPADTPLDRNNRIVPKEVKVRFGNTYPDVPAEEVELMDVSPMQIVSVATSLIPFLENDDANRALMGSNMQRQAVPLLRPEQPIVKTGIEYYVARDSGATVTARRRGIVTKVTAESIVVETETGEMDTYPLATMLRSNQGTCITQRPVVDVGDLVGAGSLLADGPSTDRGELALGKNVLVAFMSWHGYNYEDAILISQRLVSDDVFTSIHIEKHETEARDTKLGPEEITKDIPNVSEDQLKDLDERGIVRIGAEVRAEDILVGKVAPKGQGELTAEERLIIAIFGKKAEETRDVSLRVPHGEKGVVVDVKVFSRYKYSCMKCHHEYNFSKKPESLECERCAGELARLQGDELPAGVNQLVRVYIAQKRRIMEGDKMAGRHGNKGVVSRIVPPEDLPYLPDGTPVDMVLNPLGVPSRMNIGQVMELHLGYAGKALGVSFVNPIFQGATEHEILGDLAAVVEAQRKAMIPTYLRSELGVELSLTGKETSAEILDLLTVGLAEWEPQDIREIARRLSCQGEAVDWMFQEEAEEIDEKRLKKHLPEILRLIRDQVEKNCEKRIGFNERTAKCPLRDGRTGEQFDQDVSIGYMYMLKLAHLVDDKIHARSTGPYSLVTQQPLGGKAQFGGQRFGEMEVWALEAYGAAHTLQEILTIKSDDVQGRVKTYEAIVKGESILDPGTPESFKILANELKSLGLKVTVEDNRGNEVNLWQQDEDAYDRRPRMDMPKRELV